MSHPSLLAVGAAVIFLGVGRGYFPYMTYLLNSKMAARLLLFKIWRKFQRKHETGEHRALLNKIYFRICFSLLCCIVPVFVRSKKHGAMHGSSIQRNDSNVGLLPRHVNFAAFYSSVFGKRVSGRVLKCRWILVTPMKGFNTRQNISQRLSSSWLIRQSQ